MTPFELLEPVTIGEAVSLLDPDDPTVRPLAGGTALMLMMKSGVFRPTRIVSLRKLSKSLAAITLDGGALTIGALAPLSALERSDVIRKQAPVLAQALRDLSNVRVRNVATIGGHLAHADPHMDLPPVLMALGASVAVAGRKGERTLPVEQLCAGYFETTLARDELITAVTIPAQAGRRAAYLKCTTRAAHDWPALGVAVSLDADDGVIRDARIVVSAATEKATRLASVEAVLRGKSADDLTLRRAGDAAADEPEAVDDAHGSAEYKRVLLRAYVPRAIRRALEARPGARN